MKQTILKEGPLAVYKGVTPPLLATGVVNSALFGMQGVVIGAMHQSSEPPPIATIAKSAVVTGFLISFRT